MSNVFSQKAIQFLQLNFEWTNRRFDTRPVTAADAANPDRTFPNSLFRTTGTDNILATSVWAIIRANKILNDNEKQTLTHLN